MLLPISGCFRENRGLPRETMLNFFAEVELILILKIVLLYEVEVDFGFNFYFVYYDVTMAD